MQTNKLQLNRILIILPVIVILPTIISDCNSPKSLGDVDIPMRGDRPFGTPSIRSLDTSVVGVIGSQPSGISLARGDDRSRTISYSTDEEQIDEHPAEIEGQRIRFEAA